LVILTCWLCGICTAQITVMLLATMNIFSASTLNRLLGGYEIASKNDSGQLISYIGNYVAYIQLTVENMSLVYYGYNMIINQNVELEKKGELLEGDELIGNRCLKLGGEGVNVAETMFKTNIPKSYPKWCYGIFNNSNIVLTNIERELQPSPYQKKEHIEITAQATSEDLKIILADKEYRKGNNIWYISQNGKKWFVLGAGEIAKLNNEKEKGEADKRTAPEVYTKISQDKKTYNLFDILYDHNVLVIKPKDDSKWDQMLSIIKNTTVIAGMTYKEGVEKAQWRVTSR